MKHADLAESMERLMEMLRRQPETELVNQLRDELQYFKQRNSDGNLSLPLPKSPRRVIWFAVRDDYFGDDAELSRAVTEVYDRLFGFGSFKQA